MQLTKDQLEELARDVCPHCQAGAAVRLRADTREYVHDQVKNKLGTLQPGHSICWANGLRQRYDAERAAK